MTRGIARQAEEIKNKAERGSERRLWAASSDEEDVVRRYRQIQSLFRQLQVSTLGCVDRLTLTNL
jgi:hypothetical protein